MGNLLEKPWDIIGWGCLSIIVLLLIVVVGIGALYVANQVWLANAKARSRTIQLRKGQVWAFCTTGGVWGRMTIESVTPRGSVEISFDRSSSRFHESIESFRERIDNQDAHLVKEAE